ncbi:hypothetical protein KUTeg_005666 [Tegillarca granosa]|uniref:Calx-beta domain-containing protein n=1 Tax=Tegillarca granosa TaxID=220873 RepID=A0ABQ9FLH8_TEGGR|nr:hypothetical protein KUTeg_005666 [Tegillarca granosa]
MEKDGRAKVNIMRHGNLEKRVLFKVETFDGTAEKDADYKPIKETLVFEPHETSKSVEIEIIDDDVWEPDEIFFLRLSVDNDQPANCGKRQITSVILETFQFPKPSYLFKESAGTALVPVNREFGADGEVKVKWKTNDISAVGGRDFENTSGELVFKHGETTKMIEILLKDDKEFEKDENFEIELLSATTGGKIGNRKRCVVTIVNDDEFDGFVSRIADLTNANLDALRMHKESWGQQFIEAMNVNGGDLDNATTFAYVMHFFSFGFKVIFALIPPPSIWGGWLCFFVSLVFLGLLTAIVGDLATIFGCLIDLKDLVTAITFVALGTSLPDLFASKQAAAMEKTADCAIGNVTGSNSVNVFLGLGFPWLIASIYWTSQGKTYEVPAGILSFSVTLYVICAVLGLALLVVRRYVGFFGKAELGGPKGPKIVSGIILIFLWIFYVVMSSLAAYEHVPTF